MQLRAWRPTSRPWVASEPPTGSRGGLCPADLQVGSPARWTSCSRRLLSVFVGFERCSKRSGRRDVDLPGYVERYAVDLVCALPCEESFPDVGKDAVGVAFVGRAV